MVIGAAVLAACASVGLQAVSLEIVLMTALVLVGALAVGGGQPGPGVLRDAAVAVFPVLYIGLPLGALAAIRAMGGRAAILVLLVVMVVSDSAQYYTGRTFGRRPLAPSISPKKTVEGALGGLIFGTAAMIVAGLRVFAEPRPLLLAIARRNRRRARHRRGSVRVAAQTERRREGLFGVDSRPRRSARSTRQLAVRRAGLLRVRPLPSMKSIAILGSTGSIGQSALAVVDAHPDRLRVVALAAGGNVARLASQIRQYRPERVAMATAGALAEARASLAADGVEAPAEFIGGAEGLIAVATHPDADVVLFASSGTAALDAVLAAIDAGKTIALANKEILVMAGIAGDGGRAHARCGRPAGGQRAQRHPPVSARSGHQRRPPADPHRVRRSVPVVAG